MNKSFITSGPVQQVEEISTLASSYLVGCFLASMEITFESKEIISCVLMLLDMA